MCNVLGFCVLFMSQKLDNCTKEQTLLPQKAYIDAMRLYADALEEQAYWGTNMSSLENHFIKWLMIYFHTTGEV